jgi:predicted permease
MDEELDAYVDASAEHKRRLGLSFEAARRAALRELGGRNSVKQKVWSTRWEATVDGIWQDVRLSLRMLAKSPGFTLVAVVSLALGIGANTAIFTLINQVLLRELRVEKPKELAIFGNSRGGGILGGIDLGVHDQTTYDFGKQLEADPGPFAGVASYASFAPQASVRAAGAGGTRSGEAVQELVSLVSGNYFQVIGARPLLGRAILPSDAAAKGESAVAVVSWHYWQTELGGEAAALGRTIAINGTSFRVIGVMPQGFYGITQGVQLPDLFVPVTMQQVVLPGADLLQPHSFYFLHMFGRMKSPADLKQDQAWLDGQVRSYIRAQAGAAITPDREKEIARAGMKLIPGAQGVNALGGNFGASLKILMVVVGLVLLSACANLANYLLARAAARQRETATRLALGLSLGRIVRQSLAETLLLSLTGGVLGLGLAFVATRTLIAFVVKDAVNTPLDARPDGLVLLFTLGVSLLTGLLFGLGPALSTAWSAGRGGAAALSASTRSTTASGAARLMPRVLVVAQVMLSLLLLVGAGLFLRSLNNLQKQDFGFERTHMLLAQFDAHQSGYKPEQAPALFRTMLERIEALPGVESAAMSATPPISQGEWHESMHVEGYKPQPKEDMAPILNRISEHYFATTGIRILAGRSIGPEDTATSMKAVVINETAAKRYFPKGDAIGKTIKFDDDQMGGPWRIVGVARNSRVGGPHDTDPETMAFVPMTQMTGDNVFVFTIEVRTAMDAKQTAVDLRRAVAAVDPNLALIQVHTVQQEVDGMLTFEELIGSLTGIFSVLALVLAAIGLYGVMSYSVVRRTSEIGIRLALGAQTKAVLWMVLRESLVLLGIGLAVGLPLTLAATRLIREQLFGLSAMDPTTFAVAIGVVAAMTLLAAWLPARVDPMVALRCE